MFIKKICYVFLAFFLALSTVPSVSQASSTADVLYNLGDMFRSADMAREAYERHRSGSEALRYEREWREREYQLEEARIDRMARESRMSRQQIRDWRERGLGWDDISRRSKIDPRVIEYGRHGYGGYDRDHDRDLYHRYYKEHPGKAKGHYKGTPDGPPGQYKHNKKDKDRRHDDKDRGRDWHDDKRKEHKDKKDKGRRD